MSVCAKRLLTKPGCWEVFVLYSQFNCNYTLSVTVNIFYIKYLMLCKSLMTLQKTDMDDRSNVVVRL